MYSHGDSRMSNKDRFIRATIKIQMLQKHRTLGTEHNYKEKTKKYVIYDNLYKLIRPITYVAILFLANRIISSNKE